MDRLSFLANKYRISIDDEKEGVYLRHKFTLFSKEHMINIIIFIMSILFVLLILKVKEINIGWSILIFVLILVALGIIVTVFSSYLDSVCINKNEIIFRKNLIKGTIKRTSKTTFKITKEILKVDYRHYTIHTIKLDFHAIDEKIKYSFFEIAHESYNVLDEKEVLETEELGNLILKEI